MIANAIRSPQSEIQSNGLPAPPTRRPLWWAVWAGALGGGCLFLLSYRGLVDDAYITLAFAKNVAFHGQWAVTPGLLSNTATSPLYVLLLAAVTVITRAPVVSLGIVLVVSVATTSLMVTLVARCNRWASWAGPVVVVLLVTSPLMASTLGLESFLVIALLAMLLRAVTRRGLTATGVLCGLLVLARPDAGVFALAAVVALHAVRRPTSPAPVLRILMQPTAVALLVVAPWIGVSTLLFGSPIPDTLVWKTAQTQGLGGRSFGDAVPLFIEKWPAATILSVGLVACGAVALACWIIRGPAQPVTVLFGAGGLSHYLLMTLLEVPPFTWYYAPTTAAAAVLVGLGLAAALRPQKVLWRRAARTTRHSAPVRFLLAAPALLLVATCLGYAVKHDYRAQSSPFHANGATAEQYASIAATIPAGQVLETAHGEVGALAYFCPCTVVDPLSDPGRMTPVIEAQLMDPGLRGVVLRGLYSSWSPAEPKRADWRTRYVPVGGFEVWSGYAGRGHLAVEPVS